MLVRLEFGEGAAPDALGGGVCRGEFGVAALEGDEFGEEAVVFAVGDLGLRLGVVQLVVAIDLAAKLRDALFLRRGR